MNMNWTTTVKQHGAVLVVSLIMLLMLTLIAVSSMQTTVLEEKMAGNYKNKNSAFAAAEAALRAGESYLDTTGILPVFDGTTPGLYQPSSSGKSQWDVIDWKTAAINMPNAGKLADIPDAPKYIIEELPATSLILGEPGPDPQFYRVTARAFGNTKSAVVMLQSTYKR